jgi:hypothetical protein
MQMPRFYRFLILFAFCAAPAAFAQTIPANTPIAVRLEQTVSSRKAIANHRVKAQIASDIVVNGDIVLPKGAMAAVYVESVQPGGDSSKPAALWLRLDAIAVDGRAYPVTARNVGEQLPANAEASTLAKLETVSETGDQDPLDADQVTYHSATVLNFQLKSPVQLSR